jgi:putative aldouronate transport system permease protein
MDTKNLEFTKKHIILPSGKKIKKNQLENGPVIKASKWGIVANIIIGIVLAGVVFVAIIPMWHTLMSSLSDGQQLIAHEGLALWWVNPAGRANWAGYAKTIQYSNFAIMKSYAITIMYVIGNMVFGLVLNIISAYVIYRKTKLTKFIIMLILVPMLFKGGVIPTYMVIRQIGFINTPWALMIPNCTNAMFVMLQYNAFRQVPRSTVEAAEIDGASHFDIMFKVLLPQSIGLTVVILINTAIITWNSWFQASIYVTTRQDLWPLQLWIRQVVADNANIINVQLPDWDKYLVSYAVVIVATLPILLIMPYIQKQIQKGALIGAEKG